MKWWSERGEREKMRGTSGGGEDVEGEEERQEKERERQKSETEKRLGGGARERWGREQRESEKE